MIDDPYDAFLVSLAASSRHGNGDMDATTRIYILGAKFDEAVEAGDRSTLEAIRDELRGLTVLANGHANALKTRFLEVLEERIGPSQ